MHSFVPRKKVKVEVHPTLCNLMDWSLPGSSVPGILQAKNTGVGCHFLLQGIFPTQGSNPGLPHCRQILYHLSHEGSPWSYSKLSFGCLKYVLNDSDIDVAYLYQQLILHRHESCMYVT